MEATKREHIPDEYVCAAVKRYKETRGDFPYETLAKDFQCDEKLAYSACERACARGLIEYGVSLRTGWLTEKGEALINTPR